VSNSASKPPAPDQLAETCLVGDGNYSKEQRDIAFATALLQSGAVTERALSTALATWTIHGSVPLADHLIKSGLIEAPQAGEIANQAAARLEACGNDLAKDGRASTRGDSLLLSTLDQLDRSGVVTRLLGIRVAAGINNQEESRRLKARFRLVRKLGQGGLGRVWLALDESMNRYVALKEITATAGAEQALDRFRREAEITGRLEHPGIVPVYQLGDDLDSGQAFYAMRFLGKQTLQDAIVEYHERREDGDDNPMLIRGLLTAFVSVCQAIGHAHSRKVIHRDLKPENVAIDSFGQVIVIDWGLAKVIDEVGLGDRFSDLSMAGNDAQQQTMVGQVLGTPLYMAPEQAAGRIDELDERTDIYGLGAILFAILTGQAPHEQTRNSSSAITTRELISAIASEPSPSPRALNNDVDPALAAICVKAMSRRRYARYQTASELADDVQRWMAGERVSAHREGVSRSLTRWMRQHRVLSQLLAVGLIVALVTGATLAISSRQNRAAEAQIRFDRMRGEAHELAVLFEGTASDLTKDVRFMSALPPIQGLARARGGSAEDDEQVWRERLETIYEGALRANPDYLSIAMATVDADGAKELVRVERHSSDVSFVRRVPASRLRALAADDPRMQTASELEPAEVKLFVEAPQGESAAGAAQRVRLTGLIPVYDDQTGKLFGFVTITTDLTERIREVLVGLDDRTSEIYITGSKGRVWVASTPAFGVELESRPRNVAELVPGSEKLFTADEPHLASANRRWLAHRVELDPGDAATIVGIVLVATDE